MKIQVRQGVFETNSSSTHAVSACLKDEWDKIKSGKYWIRPCDLQALECEEAEIHNKKYIDSILKSINEDNNCQHNIDDIIDDIIDDNRTELFWSYDDCMDILRYNWFLNNIKLSNGVDVVSYGYYGYDY